MEFGIDAVPVCNVGLKHLLLVSVSIAIAIEWFGFGSVS
jgi:hypothetical protein